MWALEAKAGTGLVKCAVGLSTVHSAHPCLICHQLSRADLPNPMTGKTKLAYVKNSDTECLLVS